ncbi:MAG: hypothetical protein EHM28_02025 [Spirochaetaceae bacterium]|nr:MAG: hypothetical protein EHM28_02025 [Spirochaetaceae bacterium]
MRRFLLPLLLLAVFIFPLGSLEKTQGNLKIVLHEKTGKFSLYSALGESGKELFPLLVSNDPRTTSLSVVVNNTIYVMGESGQFRQTVEDLPTGARYVWLSPALKVTQEFTFLKAGETPLTEGISVKINVENRSERPASIGIRFLFDTYLGEKTATHFMTDRESLVAMEKTVMAADMGAFWISPLIGAGKGDGFIVLTSGGDITVPDSVVFANWKRLKDASWDYRGISTRDFSYYPYSFNDSAVCQYYNPASIAKGATRTVVVVMGNSSTFQTQKGTIVASIQTTDQVRTARSQDRTSVAESASDVTGSSLGAILKSFTRGNYDLVKEEVAYINELVRNINERIAAGKPVSNEDLATLRAMLQEIETRAIR